MAEIRVRRGTTLEWLRSNPVLGPGEPGYNSTSRRLKVGDGATPWRDLPYLDESSSAGLLLQEHVDSETPHPVYDDGPSLVLLYQNAQV